MATIETCGSTLFYHHAGTGTPVLLLHSSACRGGFLGSLIDRMGPGFCCYAPDLAGYGKSACSYLGHDLRAQAEFVAPLLWHNDEAFHLIGHSFGGAVALAVALKWPSRIRSLTLYEPSAFSLLQAGDASDRELLEIVAAVPTMMQRSIAIGSNEDAMAYFIDFWSGAGNWASKHAQERAALVPLAGKVIEDFRMLFEMNWRGLAGLDVPTLILHGDRSPPAAAAVARLLVEQLRTARLVAISNLEHMAPVTNSDVIAPVVMEHLLLCERNVQFEPSSGPGQTITVSFNR